MFLRSDPKRLHRKLSFVMRGVETPAWKELRLSYNHEILGGGALREIPNVVTRNVLILWSMSYQHR